LTGAAPLLVQGATAYPLSVASARVRVGQHIPFLSAHGVELVHRPALSEREYALLISPASRLRKAALLARCAARTAGAPRREGLLLLHRLLLLTPLPGVDPPAHLDAYDVDDALFVGSPAKSSARYQWLKREAQRSETATRRARLVITANTYLADHARTLNRNVEVVPSCVDPRLQRRSVHGVREVTSIGWIGSHTTIEYLAPVIPAVRRLHESGTPVKLTVIGGDSGVREPWIEHRDWSAQRQSSDLAEMDIGVMPLPDTEWTRGKAGYKLLQYFSAAVPAVGSPVGINAELLSDGRGIAVSSDADWERALLELVSDPAGRAQRGERARSFVEREYSYDRWSPELAMMLRTLA
jgi:hypothetical protein